MLKKKNEILPRVILTALSALTIGVIFFHSSLDAEVSGEESGFFLEAVNRFLTSIHLDMAVTDFMIRKSAHFFEYAVLGSLLFFTVYSYKKKAVFSGYFTPALGLSVAAADEWIQFYSLGRSSEIRDVLLDFFAVLTATLVCFLVSYFKEKKRARA